MQLMMQDSGSASKRLSHLVFPGFSGGSAELQEGSVEPRPSRLTEHVPASHDGLMYLRGTICPAQTRIEFALHLERDYRHLHTHYVYVVWFEVERVSPIPVSHFDLKITMHVEPRAFNVHLRCVALDPYL